MPLQRSICWINNAKGRHPTNSSSYIRLDVAERLKSKKVSVLHTQLPFPHVVFADHKMSVYSVTGAALVSAEHSHSHSLALSGCRLRNRKKDCFNKEFITRIHIDLTPECLYAEFRENNDCRSGAIVAGKSFGVIVEMGY